MILHVLVVRDRTSDVFGQPHYHTSVGGAVRAFGDEVNRVDVNNMLNKHPGDFDLYEVGTYNDSDASFDLFEKPRQVAIGKDMVRKK